MPGSAQEPLEDATNAVIICVDTSGRFTQWNRRASELTGWTKEEVLGLRADELPGVDDVHANFSRLVANALCGRVDLENISVPFRSKKGADLELLLNATTQHYLDRRVAGAVIVGQDVTQDVHAGAKARNATMFTVDLEGAIVSWPTCMARFSGISNEHAVGKSFVDNFVDEENRFEAQAWLYLVRSSPGTSTGIVCTFSFANGQTHNAMLSASWRDDALIDLFVQPERQTEMLADDLMRVINNANAPIFGIDTHGNVTEWNKMVASITGRSKAETVGRPFVETFIRRECRQDVGAVMRQALDGIETTNFEFPLFSVTGERREILLNATTRRGADGEIIGVIGVGQDITQLRQVTAEHERIADDLHRLIESANAPIFGVDVRGRVTEWNSCAARLSGYSKQETLGRALVEEFIFQCHRQAVDTVIQEALHGIETENFEFPLLTKDGRTVDILLNAATRRDACGHVVGMIGVGQDIGDQKRTLDKAQQAASEMTRIIQTANAPIFGIDKHGCVTEWNRKAAEISGWEGEDAVGAKLVSSFVPESKQIEVERVLQDALEGVDATSFEFPMMMREGTVRELLLNACARLSATDEIIGVICVGQDTTELNAQRREAERIAEDLSRLIETANAPIFGVDRQARVTVWNNKMTTISGHEYVDVIDKPLVQNFISEEHRNAVAYILLRALGGESVSTFELAFFTKDGDRREVLMNAMPRCGPNGEVTGVISIGHDITETRRVAANRARESEDMARLIRSANAPIVGVDVAGNLMEWNDKIAFLSGFSKEEVFGKSLVDCFIHEDAREHVRETITQALSGVTLQQDGEVELPIVTKDGSPITLTMNGATYRDHTGNVAGMVACGQDVTKIRQAMLDMKKVAEDFARLIDTANAPILGIDVHGLVTEWNQNVAQITGYSKEETAGKPLIQTFIIESYQEEVGRILENAIKGIETVNFEFPLFTKAGERREILMNATTRRAANGDVTGVIGVGQDITELRKMASAQQRVADDLTQVIQTANAPIFGIDVEGRVTEWNLMAARISGWTKEDTVGKPLVQSFITEAYREEVGRVLQRALEGGETANFEFPLFTRDGERREILLNATTRRGADGIVTGVIGVGQDITELRQVAAEQQHAAEDLSRMVEGANAPIFGVDVHGRVVEWNRKAAELSGYTRAETLGKLLVAEFITQDYKEKVQEVLDNALQGEHIANFEFPLISKCGTQLDILLNATARYNAQGQVTGVVGVGQDITVLRQAMEHHAHVADDLTRLIDTANAPILGIDVNGKVTEWNRRAAEISGWSKEETCGKALVQTYITEEYRSEVWGVLQRALDGNETANFEFPLYTRSGERREILLNATTRRGADGHIIGVIGVGQDITEMRALMRNADAQKDDLARLVETANAPIFGFDTGGRVTEWNRKAAQITGFYKEDTLNRLFVREFIHPDHQERVEDVFQRALGGSEVGNFELPLYSKSGHKRDILLNATPRWDTNGVIVGVVGVGQDITELKKQRQEALIMAQEMMNLINTASAPIIGIDREGFVKEWNSRVIDVTGFGREEVVGHSFLNYVVESCQRETHRVLKDAFQGDSTPNFEVLVSCKAGPPVVFLLSVAPRLGANGEIFGVICIGQDITHMKELELKKSRFMAMVTHELRSPLHGIIGLSDNLLEDQTNRHALKPLRMINNCARRLLDLVTNIMDLSTLSQSKNMILSQDPVHIAKIIEEVIMLTSLAVDKAGRPVRKPSVQLINNVSGKDIPIIEADAHRCTQMLYNVVTNALKFTYEGTVTISVLTDDAAQMLTISVADTGIGIASANLELIFRPFEQEDTSESRNHEGLGLGLSISREVAVKHGGFLRVESELGKGSTFLIGLPYTCANMKELNATLELNADRPLDWAISDASGTSTGDDGEELVKEPAWFEEKSALSTQEITANNVKSQPEVLVIEEDSSSREDLVNKIEKIGVTPLQAATAQAGMELLEQASRLPTLVFVALATPTTPGCDVTLLISIRRRWSIAELPVVAVISQGVSHEVAVNFMNLGCNETILKPIGIEGLASQIRRQQQLRDALPGRSQHLWKRCRAAVTASNVVPDVKRVYRTSRRTASMLKPLSERTLSGTAALQEPQPEPQQQDDVQRESQSGGQDAIYSLLTRMMPEDLINQLLSGAQLTFQCCDTTPIFYLDTVGLDGVLSEHSSQQGAVILSSLADNFIARGEALGLSVQALPNGGCVAALRCDEKSQVDQHQASRVALFGFSLLDCLGDILATLLHPAEAARVHGVVGMHSGPVSFGCLSKAQPHHTMAGGGRMLAARAAEVAKVRPGSFVVTLAALKQLGLDMGSCLANSSSLRAHSLHNLGYTAEQASKFCLLLRASDTTRAPAMLMPLPHSPAAQMTTELHQRSQPPPLHHACSSRLPTPTGCPPQGVALHHLQQTDVSLEHPADQLRALLGQQQLRCAHAEMNAMQFQRRLLQVQPQMAELAHIKTEQEEVIRMLTAKIRRLEVELEFLSSYQKCAEVPH